VEKFENDPLVKALKLLAGQAEKGQVIYLNRLALRSGNWRQADRRFRCRRRGFVTRCRPSLDGWFRYE
jgi:hypothetical protein